MGKFNIGIFLIFLCVYSFSWSYPANNAPIANNQNLGGSEDVPLPITLTGSDINGDPLIYSIISFPLNGNLSGSGSDMVYSPYPNFSGSDSFTFIVNDGTENSNVATVSITIAPVNDAPVTSSKSLVIHKNGTLVIQLTGSDVDGDALTFITGSPAHGSLTPVGQEFKYIPNLNYLGNDSFTFTANDGNTTSNESTVSITVSEANRYMVFFNDKAGSPFSISEPENFLSTRAIQRRSKQNILVTIEDIPLLPNYIQSVRNTGATVLYKTKWMNGVLVESASANISTLTALPCVSSVEYVAPGGRPSAGSRIRSSSKFKEVNSAATATDVQLSMLGIDAMHEAGYRGEGMLIAIMDAGFPGADTISFFEHIFTEGRFDASTSYDFVSGGANVFRHHNHGTNVWSTIGAFKDGQFKGGAYKANFILFVTEHDPTEYRIEEYNWLFAAEKADSAGADVISTSLGYSNFFDDPSMNYSPSDMNGETTVITRAAEIAASKGIAVVASAGNEGQGSPTTIGAPSDGQNVLAVGAVTAAGTISSFSSIGPSADGRIKPDVAAMGSGVSIISSNGNIATANGTSFSGPLMASLVAGVWQMLPELRASELLDTIRSRASLFKNPNNMLGYGVPNFNNIITSTDPEIVTTPASVSPNPTSGKIQIEFSDNLQSDQLKIELVDSKGSVSSLRFSPVSEKKFLVDISGNKSGLYLLRCQSGIHYSIHKIIKID